MTDAAQRAQNAVRAALAADGPLARAHPGLRPRQAQLDMALAVADTFQAGGVLAVEAGTGIGKTYAYLVPLLQSGRRAIVSTATQALQDQLFGRDIPSVSRALGLPVRAALLKGRSSYVCLHRLAQVRQGGLGPGRLEPRQAADLERVHHWASVSRSGDLAELSGLDEHSALRPWISSTRENCLGGSCPRLVECHVNRARDEALAAEVVVINHHLFFADQGLREAGVAELLPRAGAVVFDEAHQLNETGIQFLGRALGATRLRDFARDLAAQGPRWARGLQPWGHLALALEQALRAVADLPREGPPGRHRWRGDAPEGVAVVRWAAAVTQLTQALVQAARALGATAQAAAELQRLLERAQALRSEWHGLTRPDAADGVALASVRWMEWGTPGPGGAGWRIVDTPLDSAAWFQRWLADPSSGDCGWVFTSATLGEGEALNGFTRRLGLDALPRLRTLRLPSPFDHARQAALYVPEGLPDPGDPAHTPALALAVARWASCLGGRTLVLTTTLRAASRLAAQLRQAVDEGRCASLEVLAQGQGARRALLARFRAVAAATGDLAGAPAGGAVLIASAAFWEGVDLAGDVLQLVVIDKLPFPPPDDPLVQARSRQLEAQGLSAFNDGMLPDAALALQQGAGRLIRSETDRGVLVVGDRRLLTRSYGPRLLAALPPMRRLLDEDELIRELEGLTRPSTTDRCGS